MEIIKFINIMNIINMIINIVLIGIIYWNIYTCNANGLYVILKASSNRAGFI